ncbi:MAG: hypothetical protein ABII71_04010 [Candidatus Micrarchaeota archaeon]
MVVLLIGMSSFLYALQLILSKYVLTNMDFLDGTILIGGSNMFVVISLLLSRRTRGNAVADFRSTGALAIIVFIAVSIAAVLIYFYALMQGSSSLISVLSGFQMVAVFAIATILSFRAPNLLREETHPKHLLLKAFAIALMIAGLALIYL